MNMMVGLYIRHYHLRQKKLTLIVLELLVIFCNISTTMIIPYFFDIISAAQRLMKQIRKIWVLLCFLTNGVLSRIENEGNSHNFF